MEQLLKSTPNTLEFLVYQGDTLTNLDATPTLAVVDDQGNTVTAGAVTNPATGTYRATLNTPAQLTTLTATLTGALSGDPVTLVNQYEVVGAFLFPLAELSSIAGLEATSDSRLREARTAVTNLFGDFCGVDFVPRPRHEIHDGSGRDAIWLRWPRATALRAVEIGGVAETVADLHLYDSGRLVRDAGWPKDNRNVEVWYEAGHQFTPPEIRRVAVIAAADQILAETNTITSRALGVTNEFGNLRYAPHRPTGLPAVDGVLKHYVIPRVA